MDALEDYRAVRSLRIAAIAIGSLAYWGLVFWDPTWDLKPLDAWLFLPTDPMPQVIFLVAAALAYRRRNFLRSAMQPEGSAILAGLPLLLGLALFVWGYYVDAMDLVLVSFILVTIGTGLLWFGVRFARELAIPWVVLAFAYPVPAVVTNQAFYALRLWAATHSAALLRFVGVPVFKEGNVISGPGVIAQVIDTCSGLRSIEILTLVAVFYVSWFPARRLRQALLVVSAPLVAYGFNLIRICVIAVAPTSEYSAAHTFQGLTVYFGAIAGLIVIDRVLGHLLPGKARPRRVEPRATTAPGVQQVSQSEGHPEVSTEAGEDSAIAPRSSGRIGAAAIAVLAAVMLGVSIGMPRWSVPEEQAEVAAIRLPAEFHGWKRTERIRPDDGYLSTVRFSKTEYWIYERDGEEISVFVGVDDRGSRSRSPLSRKNEVPRRGFEVLQRDSVTLEPLEMPVTRVVAQSQLANVLTYTWYEESEGLIGEILRALFAADLSPFRRVEPARVIRVATAVDSNPAARVEEEANLRAFAASLVAALRE
ncbi:MAG: exosortase-associated EpsI family protein [Deltaproteobacteria bacterium]|jgi:exosortase|nr:exosortase-associated EpsI family protein [Deltaproteobacteria bacterium]